MIISGRIIEVSRTFNGIITTILACTLARLINISYILVWSKLVYHVSHFLGSSRNAHVFQA